MISEFAIDPTVLADRTRRRFFFMQLGVEHGRLIAEIPKFNRWRRSIWEAAESAGVSDMELKRLENDLVMAMDKVCVRNARYAYDGNRTWLANAEASSASLRAVIAAGNKHEDQKVVSADEVDDSTPQWKVDRHLEIRRDGKDLASACSTLFDISFRLKLVDPNFDPSGKRWRRGLAALLQAFEQRRRRVGCNVDGDPQVELHVSAKVSSRDHEVWRRDVENLGDVLPSGLSMRVVRWQEAADGTRMHARYVLTERGGIEVNYGLDAPGRGTTHLTLLDNGFHHRAWLDFSTMTSRFVFVDKVEVVGGAA